MSEALTFVERIHAAGVTLALTEENIDPTGPFGEFLLTTLLVSAPELNTLEAGRRTAKSRAMDRGVKIGPTPFGYQRADDATLQPHADFAPVVAEAFRLTSEQDLHAAVDYLNPIPTAHEDGARKGRDRSFSFASTVLPPRSCTPWAEA